MSSAPDLAPGARLDRYEIIRRISRGGMATVWIARLLGEPPGSAKLFALKTILPELAGDPDMRAMFVNIQIDGLTLAITGPFADV